MGIHGFRAPLVSMTRRRVAAPCAAGLGVCAALVLATACDGGPGAQKQAPELQVASPLRGSMLPAATSVMVTGSVGAGPNGAAVEQVLVNGVKAKLASDGSFTAQLSLGEGITLIRTEATDANGTVASDTRAVAAGELRPVGTNVPTAVSAALSADAFAKLSAAAGPLIKGLDLGAMLAPLQPMISVGSGSTYAKVSILDVKLDDFKVSLAPVQGGLRFRAEVTKLVVPGNVEFKLVVGPYNEGVRVTADKVVIAGVLDVKPNGMAGFTTKILDPDVQVAGFALTAENVPTAILDLINFKSAIGTVIAKAAELAMTPLMNSALGALGGPQRLAVLGTQLDMQVAPTALSFDPSGALLAVDMKMALGGGEASPGFLYTANGAPALDATEGFQIGLADDLVNELLAELVGSGKLDLSLAVPGGLFDTAALKMTLAPMVNADATTGNLRIVLGDMMATFLAGEAPVAKAAINAAVELKVTPSPNGGSVALQLGTPEIHIDVVDDVENTTGFEDGQLEVASSALLTAQLEAISVLLVAIPVPSIGGLNVSNLSLASDSGYVMMKGKFL